jgi:hypothetical protein
VRLVQTGVVLQEFLTPLFELGDGYEAVTLLARYRLTS